MPVDTIVIVHSAIKGNTTFKASYYNISNVNQRGEKKEMNVACTVLKRDFPANNQK